MNSGISDSDSGQNTKMAGLSQNQCPVYRGMTVRVMPESVSGLLRNMQICFRRFEKCVSKVLPE